ncbi:MAG: hypothetical protein ACE5ED_11255 [Rhodothalassiaceae bacterium]
MRWKLEDGTPVTPEDLAEEITRVPRTRFWRLSHMVFLWPGDADPEEMSGATGGFSDGFVLELVAPEGTVEWLIQPIEGDAQERITGEAPVGRKAVLAAFAELERLVREREAQRKG